MTTTRFPRPRFNGTATSVGSVLLWGIAFFTVVSVLLCLPAFHSAVGLHGQGDAVDALDLGASVPKPAGSRLPVAIGIWTLTILGLQNTRAARTGFLRSPDLVRKALRRVDVRLRMHAVHGRGRDKTDTSGSQSCDDDRRLSLVHFRSANAPRFPRIHAGRGASYWTRSHTEKMGEGSDIQT